MSQAAWVFVVLAATIAAFASDRLRLDLVAMLSLLTLALTGVLTPAEALAGFAEPLTLMIAGLFVVGAGLFETGAADRLGDALSRVAGRDPLRLLLATMLVSALLSAFLSSTGTVAVLLPVVVTLARGARVPPSQLLMPLAFGSLLGGMMTLIGTPPNLVVSDQLRAQGLEPFGFFAFAPVGAVMLVLGLAYMALVGRRLLPKHAAPEARSEPTLEEMWHAYQLDARLHRVEVPYGSPLADRTLTEAELRTRFAVTVLAIESPGPEGRRARRAEPNSLIRPDDALYLSADRSALEAFLRGTGTRLDDDATVRLPDPVMLLEAIVPPRSDLVGRTLAEVRLHREARVTAVAARRGDEVIHADMAGRPVRVGDTLLLAGGRDALKRLFADRERLLVVGAPREWEQWQRDPRRMGWAVAVLGGLLVLMGFGLVPNVLAVLAAAVAMVLTRCVGAAEAYRSIHWEAVVLVAAMLPLATALEKSGGMAMLVEALVGGLGAAGPYALMAAFFLVTAALSQVVSNTATTVLLAPVAFATAGNLGVAPQPLLMTMAVAASTAFATPIASPVNALVLAPGGYKFRDFLRVGLPMVLLLLPATLLVVPWFFPLHP